MSTSLRVTNSLTLRATLTDDIGSYAGGPNNIGSLNANGTAINQNDVAFWGRFMVANGTPVNIDLSGSLTMPGGAAAVFAKVTELYIINQDAAANTTHVLTAGGGTNALAWLPAQAVGGPGSDLLRRCNTLAALPVTASTADILQLTSAAGTIPVDVIIIGRSA